MKLRVPMALMAMLVGAAGCSSAALPSIPWFSSAPAVDPSAEALFEEGNRAFNEKKYVRALDRFSKLRSDHPFSPLMTQVELKMADAYYLNEQYPEAINAFKEFQSMHPTNENMPFVLLRLGQAHFDQFTATDRDQKNTEIAKNYFEDVVTNHPKSPQAVEATEKLAKCLQYLAEHEFNIAHFYLQQEKFAAARDRFEEIIRKYKSTPTAIKSLFYLGESYRVDKNPAQAALAYEALLQHYPESKYAAEAKTQLAIVEQEKRDPLDLVLRRDRRRIGAPEVKEDPAFAKLKDVNLIAKKEVVYEEPGAEKSFFRRVTDKINPFSSSDDEKKTDNKNAETKPETGLDLVARRQSQKQESSGFFASLWPFGSDKAKPSEPTSTANSAAVISRVDASLQREGIDEAAGQNASKPPVADLPKQEAKAAPPLVDTKTLLGSIDGNLQKTGSNSVEVPAPPDADAAFREFAANKAALTEIETRKASPQNVQVQTDNVISSIDQRLKAQGLEPAKFDRPPTAEELKARAAQNPKIEQVEIKPKLDLGKGPLFLSPNEAAQQENPSANTPIAARDIITPESNPEASTAAREAPDRLLVKGPIATSSTFAIKQSTETKSLSNGQADAIKGGIEQMRQDAESIGKILNPFNW